MKSGPTAPGDLTPYEFVKEQAAMLQEQRLHLNLAHT